MSERKIIRVSDESEQIARKYSEAKGIGIGEAADLLFKTADSRLGCLKRYAENHTAPPKPRKKKEKVAAKASSKTGAKKKKAAKRAPKAASNGVAEHVAEA